MNVEQQQLYWTQDKLVLLLEPTRAADSSAADRPADLIYNQREAWEYYLKFTKVSDCTPSNKLLYNDNVYRQRKRHVSVAIEQMPMTSLGLLVSLLD